MADVLDKNGKVIAEFRANGGKVGGRHEGAALVVLHHVGRKSGTAFVTPVRYLAASDLPDGDAQTIYVFGTHGGAPEDPDWFLNLAATAEATIELGAETYPVTVEQITGLERDRIYAEQARQTPMFQDYADKAAGIRTIPVLALRRR